jgi:nucleotide-binding universal stress UspA family protein
MAPSGTHCAAAIATRDEVCKARLLRPENVMFNKLLVPLDGTSQSAVALPPARALAQATGADIVLLRVIPDALRGPEDSARTAAEDNLASIVEELAKSNLRVHTIVRPGAAPAEVIGRAVVTEHADLIVMATHGRAGLQRTVLGSVAQEVLTKSRVPVVVVRPGGHRVTHITTLLVPVDGSPGGALALGLAVPLARTTGARIVLLQVVVPLPADIKAQASLVAPIGEDLPWDEELLASAQQYVSQRTTRLQQAGLAVEGRATLGHISQTIVGTANDVGADLIVMSTHALRGPARAILGSVTDEVVRIAQRPVLLVRQH